MNESVTLVYLGNKFSVENANALEIFYNNEGKRYDWGVIQRDLMQGKDVVIRQAPVEDYDFYRERLESIKVA